MASAKSNAIRIGAFVVVGVLLAILALIYFGAADLFTPSQVYVTYSDRSVQGLNLDSPVKFRGVTIGKVASMEIAPDDRLIEIRMDLRPDFTVRDSLGVQMNITGITGQRYLEIDFASPGALDDSPKISFEPPYPVIPSIPGGFEEIETALKSIYQKMMMIDTEGISSEAKLFLRTGTDMVATVDSIVNQPATTAWIHDLNEGVSNLEMMIAELRRLNFHTRLDSTLTDLNAAVKQARDGAGHLNRALATLETDIDNLQVSQRADTLFRNLNRTFESTAEMVGQSQYSVTQVVARMSVTVNELNETIEQLNMLIMSLEEYPSRILYSAPPESEK